MPVYKKCDYWYRGKCGHLEEAYYGEQIEEPIISSKADEAAYISRNTILK